MAMATAVKPPNTKRSRCAQLYRLAGCGVVRGGDVEQSISGVERHESRNRCAEELPEEVSVMDLLRKVNGSP